MPASAKRAAAKIPVRKVAKSAAQPAKSRAPSLGALPEWNLTDLYNQGLLIPGHTYRFYVIVHDGDQNKVGGDAGQASFTYFYPGVVTSNPPASLSGFVYRDYGFGLRAGFAGMTV